MTSTPHHMASMSSDEPRGYGVQQREFAPPTASPEERFWSRVSRGLDGECWPWLGSTHRGYGQYYNANAFRTSQAHRIAYELLVGAIPEGLHIDHLCRVTTCVNPAHLEPVTSRENSRRSPLILKPACPNGHPYAEGSYYMDRGGRVCKECKKAKVRDYAARTGRTTARYICEFCGETRNKTGRSKHLRKVHPDHYTPRKKSEGMTPERMAVKLAQQRDRRRAASRNEGDAA